MVLVTSRAWVGRGAHGLVLTLTDLTSEIVLYHQVSSLTIRLWVQARVDVFNIRICEERQRENKVCALLLVAPLSVLVHWEQEVKKSGRLIVQVNVYQGPSLFHDLPSRTYQRPFIVLTTVHPHQ